MSRSSSVISTRKANLSEYSHVASERPLSTVRPRGVPLSRGMLKSSSEITCKVNMSIPAVTQQGNMTMRAIYEGMLKSSSEITCAGNDDTCQSHTVGGCGCDTWQ